MNSYDRPPHKISDTPEELAAYLLASAKEKRNEYFDEIFRGEVDDHLIPIFEQIAKDMIECGLVDYYFNNASADTLLDVFGLASDAYIILFKLLEVSPGTPVAISWQNHSRVIPAPTRGRSLHASHLIIVIETAYLSGNKSNLDFLCGLKREHIGLKGYVSDNYYVNYAQFKQRLFSGMDELAAQQVDSVVAKQPSKKSPDNTVYTANCKMYAGVLKKDIIDLEKRIEMQLKAHKRLYNNDRNNMRVSVFGFLDSEALSAICLATQRGKDLNTNRKYLPADIVETAWRHTA